ncbi:cyclic nucleotide-binding domain protein (macronuclear) [Tetrahymena thermophila SB210]|uniref:Cyclic nucleotide-binding domain protein n=1 Tax=Tetrahymena thermophila (strain SB210) TaxID=312017 RepID=W7X0K9_TETTS|nr:cyclic nucleotide-binding domain protein [Tetrahymena thermophila SB210]EWS72675.1 cyclic nucleotide-binding domain protein [Tetrahymena thermophila SB210]|eukprot:XP_012654800.1 cyclic nucleotide-binding domain protein [Tetrahymena thermophila SB210]
MLQDQSKQNEGSYSMISDQDEKSSSHSEKDLAPSQQLRLSIKTIEKKNDSRSNISKERKKVESIQNSCQNIFDDLEHYQGELLIEEVIKLLKINSKFRTYKDSRIITKYVSNLSFFKNHFGKNHEAMILQCAQFFKYQFCSAEDKVFEQGETGDKFYVILRGKVSIHVDFKRQDTNNEQQNQRGGGNDDVLIEKVHIRDLNEGESFGELALIDKKPRSATVTCITDCHFITFDKISFDKIIKNQQIKQFKEELLRLKKNYLFSRFSGNSLKNLYLLFQIIPFKKGDVIVKEGEKSDKIYVVREGEFKVSRTAYIKIEADATSQLNVNQKKKESIVVDLGILGPNQSFGEEEFFTQEKRKVNVVCLSRTGELMILNRREFFKKMGYDEKQIKFMEQLAQQKNLFRETQFEKLISTFSQMKQQICENKQGQYLDQQLSSIEQEQLLQKELIDSKAQTDVPNENIQPQQKSKRNQIFFKKPLLPQEDKIKEKQNNIVKYHFIRKKVISTQKNPNEQEDLQSLHNSFYQNSSLFQSSQNDNKRFKLETISSKQNQKGEGQNTKFDEASSISQTRQQKLFGQESRVSTPDKQIQQYLKKMSVMSVSLDLGRISKQPFSELQSPIILGSPKQVNSRISQFNDLNLSQCSQDSLVYDKKIQQQEETKINLNSNIHSLNDSAMINKAQEYKISKKQNYEKMKMLIDQEILHHSFFLNKKKYKTAENQFFKNLDEKLQSSNKNMQRYFNTRQKPSVQIKEIFTQKESRSPERKKIELNLDSSPKQNISSNYEQNSPIKNQQYVHYSLLNYSAAQDSDSVLDISKNTNINNQYFNKKTQNSLLLSQIVTPFIDKKKCSQYYESEYGNYQNNVQQKKRVNSMQLKKLNSFENNTNTLDKSNIKFEQSIYYQTDTFTKKKNKSSFLIKTDANQNIQKTEQSTQKTNQLSSTQYNKFLENKLKQLQTPSPKLNKNFLSQIQSPNLITKKEQILNNNSEKLPLKYFSSKLKDINEAIQQKGRFFSSSISQNKLTPQIHFKSKKVLNLSVQGLQQIKMN